MSNDDFYGPFNSKKTQKPVTQGYEGSVVVVETRPSLFRISRKESLGGRGYVYREKGIERDKETLVHGT